MELRHLCYFVTVAETLHFGQAAERLQLTQPALSKQIAGLEKELEVQLLTRTRRTVQLTAAGQVLLTQARKLLAQVDETVHLVKRTASGEEGTLSLGFTATATFTVLPTLVRRFRDRCPKVELKMQELCTEAQVSALNERKIDVAFLHPPIDERGLKLHPILEEDFVAVLPKQHPLLKYEHIPLVAFSGESLIIHPRQEGPVLYDGFIQLCQQLGFQPNIVKETISLRSRVCLAAAGIGVTFVSESAQAAVGNHDVVCRPLMNCPLKLKFAAAWRQDATAPTVREFLSILLKANEIMFAESK